MIDGEPVFENHAAAEKLCLVRGVGDATVPSVRVRDLVDYAARLRAGWDPAFAAELLEKFEVPPGEQVKALSHGERARSASRSASRPAHP